MTNWTNQVDFFELLLNDNGALKCKLLEFFVFLTTKSY